MIKELFSKLEAYANGLLSREDFSVWFYGFSRKANKRFRGEALEFIEDVEAILAESSSGGWSEQGLKDELEDLLDKYREAPNLWVFNWDFREAVQSGAFRHLDFGYRQV